MKAASPALVALLNGQTEFRIADLLTIVLADGTTVRLTSADRDVTAVSRVDNTSHTFSSAGPPFTRGQTKLVIGFEVGSLKLSIAPRAGLDTIVGVTWGQAVRQGSLDDAQVTLERVFMPSTGAWGDTSAGTVMLFSGRVGQTEPFRNEIQFDVVADIARLGATQFPRNVYQPGCLHTLFDAGCGLLRSAFATSGTAGTGSTDQLLNVSFTPPVIAGVSFPDYYSLGTIAFTSGANAGLTRSIKTWNVATPSVVELMVPFPAAPAAGDAFTIAPGCDKRITSGALTSPPFDARQGTCAAKFNNLVNARAYPFVPSPEAGF
jgi:uncharacterized phage protein (TIGR02218 family)